jgi:hypothetical protein
MQAQFNLSTGEQRSLSGFMTIDRDKLKALPGDELADLARKDELECAFLHLASLRHFRGMLERFSPKKETIGAEAEGEALAQIEENGSKARKPKQSAGTNGATS